VADRVCPGKARQQEIAIAALLTAPTLTDAAAQAKVSERTLRRWLANENFADAFAVARKQALDAAVFTLQQAVTEAVTTLRRNLNCGDRHVDVPAATAILRQALRWEERVSVEDSAR
jgi:hypothetical protein